MEIRGKAVLAVTMSVAMMTGFLHLVPGAEGWNFERLHVFLFNLCAGGSVLLYYSRGKGRITPAPVLFFMGALAYALCAFMGFYVAAVALAFALAGVVESVRAARFSFFPLEFFSPRAPVSAKFHHAALLCLSLALIASAFVIFNSEFVHIITYPRLKLDVFFLGFSFPVSLMTMGLIFSLLTPGASARYRAHAELVFWSVTAGVIVFFAFILVEAAYAQLAVSVMLCAAVAAMLAIFFRGTHDGQQRMLLASGMGFIMLTGVTGVAYVLFRIYMQDEHPAMGKAILSLHSFISLYGWNLSGLLVMMREKEFPVRARMRPVLALHWLIVLVLAPCGRISPVCAAAAAAGFAALLCRLVFAPGCGRSAQSN
jgi:hypothetical protein